MDDLRAAAICAALDATRFRHVEVHVELPSTQTLLVAQGGRDGRVVVADHQTAGRGRADRTWQSLPGRGLQFSALLRGIEPERSPLVSLAAGVAVARALEEIAALAPGLKWPNDVEVDGRKICGILGELAGGYLVCGIGVNVGHHAEELPEELNATSVLAATGHAVPRGDLLVAILRHLDTLAGAEGWLDEYRRRCVTLGAEVRVRLPEGHLEGEATELRDDGALVVAGRPVLAGDVLLVRRRT